MLASVKELFTPRRKWNQYKNVWSVLIRKRRSLRLCKKRNNRMSLNENTPRSERKSSDQSVTAAD